MLRTINFGVFAIALVLSGIASSIYPRDAFAQNSLLLDYKKIKQPRNIMNAEAKRGLAQVGRYGSDQALGQKFALPPLPGDQAFSDSAPDPDKFLKEGSKMPDFGANEQRNVSIVLPPLKGLSQILNSSVTKDLLKDLTAAETTVLMQTYMMVENGAATGFMGGMNIGSNLMSNMLQAQDFQMKLMDASDSTGKLKEAYVNRIATVMQEGDHKDVWPAALYIASGDDGKFSAEASMKPLTNPKDGVGAFTLKGITGDAGSKDNATTKKLSEILFTGGAAMSPDPKSSQNKYSYDTNQLKELREDFVKMVGDIELNLNVNKSLYARDIDIKYIAPAIPESYSDPNDKRRGVARVNYEEVRVAWQSINVILFEYCKWKEKNPNSGKQKPFELETSTTTKAIGQNPQESEVGTPWELASAPDITMSVNVIDQVLKMYEEHRPKGSPDCDALDLDEDDIPDSADANANDVNLNDCGPKQGCLKNRVVLHLSYMIARSRTLHTYRALYNISRRFVTDEFTGELLEKLFDRVFSGMDVNAELEANRARYFDFVSYMGQLTQGSIGAGPLMRPGSNNETVMAPH